MLIDQFNFNFFILREKLADLLSKVDESDYAIFILKSVPAQFMMEFSITRWESFRFNCVGKNEGIVVRKSITALLFEE